MTIGVNQTVSPIKFCFFIEPDSESNFERAMKIAFSYWGGIYSPILPLHTTLSDDFINEYGIECDALTYYTNTIENFDPDIILYDDSLDIEFIKTFIGDRTYLTIEKFLFNTEKGQIKHGISAIELIYHTVETEFKFVRNDNLKLSLPKIQDSDLFLKSFLGCFIDRFQKEIHTQLKSTPYFEEPEVNFDNITDFLSNENISILEINIKEINTVPERYWYKGEAIYFLDETRLNDIINFWNLRALGWQVAPIPFSQINNAYFIEFIERFIESQLKKRENAIINYHISTIKTNEQEQKIQEKLEEIKSKFEVDFKLSYQGWFPRFWEERGVLEYDKTLCEKIRVNSTYSQIEVQENYVRFKSENLSFNLKKKYHVKNSHKIDLTFSYFDEYFENAGLIYGIETLDWIRLAHSYSRERWRLSKTGLTYYVRDQDDDIYFYIPKAKDFFRVFFSKSGNKLNETSNGRLANEVLKNIGGIRESNFLQNKASLKILELIEGGRIVLYQQLIAEIKKNLRTNNNEEVSFFVKGILENKIIEFGAELQCQICHQHSFYLPTEMKEVMSCTICRNSFSLPMHKPNDIKWAYRGIGPFSKNNKVGGIITVFLTLKLFNQEFADISGNLSALIGFELIKDTKKEVDLAVLLQERDKDSIPPDLVFCECKTYKNFTSADADRMIELGKEFPNAILTFATLNSKLSDDEKVEILRVVNHFRTGVGSRPINPVLILTATELLPEDSYNHFSEYEDISKPYHKYNDWLGNLCEFSVMKHLGVKTWGEIQTEKWKEAMKKREEIKQKIQAKK